MHKYIILGLTATLLNAPAQLMAQQPTVEELEQRCEEMREARLAPLRKEKIEKCKAEKAMDPAQCERYYKDYGNATRGAGGKYTERMFNDLGPCVKAREMKAITREGTVPSVKRGETTTDVDKTIKELTTKPEATSASKEKASSSSRESTLESTTRDSRQPEASRDSTLPDKSRDSTSGKSDR